jgi:predicted nucleic acid-binding protein
MSHAAVDAAMPAGAIILVDTSAVLAYLSGSESASDAAAAVIDGCVATGRNPAILSAISVTELLVRPLRAGSATAVRLIDDFLGHFPNLHVESVSIEIARAAARIRAATSTPTPDALILATAVAASASIVVANDAGWPRIVKRAALPVDVVLLSALGPRSPGC